MKPLNQAGDQVQAGRYRVDELLAEQGVDPPSVELSVEGACGLDRIVAGGQLDPPGRTRRTKTRPIPSPGRRQRG